MTQALAGLARAGEGARFLDEALQLFESRRDLSFAILWTCSDETTLVELGRTALVLGRPEGSRMLERACEAESFEACTLLNKGAGT